MARLIFSWYLSVYLMLLCPCGATHAQVSSDFHPIEWIDADQAVAVRVNDFSELMTRGIASQFWSQESIASVVGSLDSDRIKELIAKAGFDTQDLFANLSSLVNEISLQQMYFFIDSRLPSSSGYMICMETKVNSIHKVEQALSKFMTATVRGFKSEDFVRYTVQETEFLTHVPSGFSAFMYRDWLFIHPNQGRAEANFRSLKGNSKPRFSFAENRKWISANEKVDARGDIEVYVDPSIARKMFPLLTPDMWQKLGLTDILGSAFRFSIDEQKSDRSSACSPVVRWEGVVRIAVPRSGFWKILDGLRPIEQVPILPVETQSALLANCDPHHVWRQLEQWIDSAMGPRVVGSIRREAEMLGFTFDTEFLSSWNGFFGNLQFGPRNSDAPQTTNEPLHQDLFGDFCVIAGVANKRNFQSIAEKIVFRGKSQYNVETESDLVLLYLSPDDLKERSRKIRERNREVEKILGPADRDQNQNAEYISANIGVALTDSLLVYGTESRGREFAYGRFVDLADSNPDIRDIYRSFDRANIAKKSFAPCLAYYFWGNEVRSSVASIIWQLESDRQAKMSTGIIDMRGFKASVPDPSTAETIEEWTTMAALNIITGVAESIHVVAVEVGVDSNGIRLRGGVFTKPEIP